MIIPKWFQDEIAQIGGLNRYGDPNLQVVDCKEARFHEAGPLKYIEWAEWKYKPVELPSGLFKPGIEVIEHPFDCLMLEEWVAPEFLGDHNQMRFGRKEYSGDLVDILGPFPTKGRYRQLILLRDKENRPFPLCELLLEFIRAVVQDTYRTIKHAPTEEPTEAESLQYMRDFNERQRKVYQNYSDQLSDVMDDAKAGLWSRMISGNFRKGIDSRISHGPNRDKKPKEQENATE